MTQSRSIMTLNPDGDNSCEATEIRMLSEVLTVFRGIQDTRQMRITSNKIKKLIDKGEDCKAKECDGLSPMDVFQSYNFDDLAKYCNNPVGGVSENKYDSL